MSLALQIPLAVIPEMKLKKKKKKDILIYWSQIVFINCKAKVKVAQLCLTLCDPMDYTVHGILQARILEWEARNKLLGHFKLPFIYYLTLKCFSVFRILPIHYSQ